MNKNLRTISTNNCLLSDTRPEMEESMVAAVVPTMNRPERLKGALESICRQTWDNIEIVIVDGGNDDETTELVTQFRETASKKITYLSNDEPRGLAAARNQGFEQTSAKYIGFLDDDDRWHPEKIELQVNRLEHSTVIGGVYCGRRTVTDSGKHTHTLIPQRKGDIYEELLVRNVVGSPSKVLVDASVYEEIDGFNEDIPYHEDWDFNLRLAKKYEWGCLSKPLLTRTIHEDNMSLDAAEKLACRERIIERNREELESLGRASEAWYHHYRQAALDYFESGNISEGRAMLRDAFEYDWEWSIVALYISTLFGPRGFRLLRNSKRGMATAISMVRRRL